jgi:glucan phosphoethanolaminetransferase (alkaline phosphatase superfamily)
MLLVIDILSTLCFTISLVLFVAMYCCAGVYRGSLFIPIGNILALIILICGFVFSSFKEKARVADEKAKMSLTFYNPSV